MVNLALQWMAPDLHSSSTASVKACQNQQAQLNPTYLSQVTDWPSSFTGITVISNRETPSHQDTGTFDAAYDILLTGGEYSDCTLRLEDIDGHFEYGPGALVAICGRVLRHEVLKWSGKDRICYAHYLKDDVLLKNECPRSGWVNFSDFHRYMGQRFKAELKGTFKIASVLEN